jgi:hypothetical protein
LPAKRRADRRIAGLDIFAIEALKFGKSVSDNPATLSEPQGAGSVVRLAGRGASSHFEAAKQRSSSVGRRRSSHIGGRPAGNQAANPAASDVTPALCREKFN